MDIAFPLPYIFGAETREVEVPSYSHSPRPALGSVEACRAHFPAWAFKTSSRGCPVPREPYKPCKRALLVFHIPWGILASLSLSSCFLYTVFWETDQLQDRGLLPFDLPPSTTNSHPDPVAQASSDGTLGHHRLSSFQGSQGTLRPKGPLGRDLGDTPPSFRVSLSLCLVEELGDDLFSRPDSC